MNVRILPDLLFQVVPHHRKPNCLMKREQSGYRNIPWQEVVESAEALAAALIDAGIRKGDRIGLLSENRIEWAYADLAILSAAAICVPIYCTLTPRQIEYICKESEVKVLFVSTPHQLEKILEFRANLPCLQTVVIFDAPDDLTSGTKSYESLLVTGAEALKKDPAVVRERLKEIDPNDVFTFVYTSGTTGEPKGVMLTHRNVLSNIDSIRTFFDFSTEDTTLSFLPLSHIFERMAGYYAMLYAGCTIAYAENMDSVVRNLGEVHPTLLMSVPRVYEKFYARITDNLASEQGAKKKIGIWAMKTASAYTDARLGSHSVPPALALQHRLADILVYRKIRARLGGHLRLLVSGGAALPRQLAYFFYGLGLTILEGYGLTETSPVIACNRPHLFKFGTVGPPVPGVDVKIAEDGEILTRGPHIMKGYYKKSKETAETITDGWLHTGDIGELDGDGFLRITDRKKDLIVTSSGKNIAPQLIENTLKTSRYIAQIIVVGDKRNFASALIVPNMENLRKFAALNNIPEVDLLQNQAVLSEVQNDIDRLSQDLAPFERVKKIVLLQTEFTIESGELTPSLKVKRNIVEKKYEDIIGRLYAEPASK